MFSKTSLSAGRPYPLGATFDGKGINFALFSENAERVELCIFDAAGEKELVRIPMTHYTNQVWHGYLEGGFEGLLYGYRVYGPFDPEHGHRFNGNKLLTDPYSRAYGGHFTWSERHLGYKTNYPHADLTFDARDNANKMFKSKVVGKSHFDWAGETRPDVPLDASVIYEVHVKGFTMKNPNIPKHIRGTYAGMGSPAAIAHLKRLGVTTVELLPIHELIDERYLAQNGLVNYWGYNSIGFFAPATRYAATDDPISEFKQMVKNLHQAGIEVLLDVVYNHTAEGNENGPTFSFKGIDNAAYYRLSPFNRRYYENYTGCGNTLNLSHPRVLQLVMDSLRYWVTEMHIDGFRFDLASAMARDHGFSNRSSFLNAIAQDPVLSKVKLIAEPWDCTGEGYQVGNFPPGWSEWNDRFRDTCRLFWLHRGTGVGEISRRLAGSSDLYRHSGRTPQASINFITAHDGFNMQDLVSYSRKHNEANGQNNNDGSDNNISWNGGVEGPTDDAALLQKRQKLKRALLATLMLSQGIPMLNAGDELGHTQQGSNNPYCQDNAITWLDWENTDESLIEFVSHLIAIRKNHPALRRPKWLERQHYGEKIRDIAWYSRNGTEMTIAEWENPDNHCLGLLLGAALTGGCDNLLMILNAHDEDVLFNLPEGDWSLLVNTALNEAHESDEPIAQGPYNVPSKSIVLLKWLENACSLNSDKKTV